jgi:hypothetical protein
MTSYKHRGAYQLKRRGASQVISKPSQKADWHFTTANARIKLKHLYPSI